jgi:uncharacterized protein YbcC (UPF0753/DUF2309 family)
VNPSGFVAGIEARYELQQVFAGQRASSKLAQYVWVYLARVNTLQSVCVNLNQWCWGVGWGCFA